MLQPLALATARWSASPLRRPRSGRSTYAAATTKCSSLTSNVVRLAVRRMVQAAWASARCSSVRSPMRTLIASADANSVIVQPLIARVPASWASSQRWTRLLADSGTKAATSSDVSRYVVNSGRRPASREPIGRRTSTGVGGASQVPGARRHRPGPCRATAGSTARPAYRAGRCRYVHPPPRDRPIHSGGPWHRRV